MRYLIMLAMFAGCDVEVKETKRAVSIVLGKSIVLDHDQPLICVYFHDKNTVVCLPPEEAFSSDRSESQML